MNMKLLFLPLFGTDVSGNKMGLPRIPPLGISVLKGYLKGKGIDIELDDLSIKSFKYNMEANETERINFEIFNDKEKMKELENGERCVEFEREGEKILNLTDLKGFDVIGFSIMNSHNPSSITVPVTLGKLIKEKFGSMVIVGGTITDGFAKRILKSGKIDYRIIGDSRTSLGEVNLFKFIQKYGSGNLEELDGISYFDNGKHKYNHRDYTADEKTIITKPNFDGLPLETYRDIIEKITGKRFLVLPYYFSKGCPNNCVYCCHSREKLFEMAGPEKIIEDIEELSRKYNTNYFLFLDNEIYAPKKYAEAFLNSNLNIKYSICADFRTLNSKVVKLLKESGAFRIMIGLETASKRIQKNINKNIDLGKAKRILKICSEENLRTTITLICGFPWERQEDIEETLEFLIRNKNHIDDVELNKFFLEGQYLENPQEFNIEIKESEDIERSKFKYFEEVDGRNREELRRHTKRAYMSISEIRNKYFGESPKVDRLLAEKIIGE